MKRVFLSIVLMVSIFAYCNAKNDYPCPSELRHLDKCAISAIYQDRSGVVWINSDFGMHRYDSYVLRTIDAHSSGHPSCFNGENLLYYTKEGGAVCLNTDSECVTSIRIPALSNPKKYILYASGSDLIAGLGQDIMTAINDSLVTVVRIPDNLGKIKAMTTSPNEGRFLAGSGNGYLLEFDLYGNLSIISSFNDEICSLFTDSDRYTYIGFENAGYVRLDSGFNTETQHRDNKSSIPRQVRAFTQTSDGRILLGTLDGLYSIDHSGCLENTSMHMPSGHAVSSLFADNRDNIWIGTFYSGLILLPKEGYPYTNIDFPKEYNVQLIDGITEDNNGNLWIATDRYGLYCYSPSKEAFRKITELGNGKFKCINYDSKRNVLWLGEYKGQLYRYDINTGNVHKFHAVDRRGNEITISVYDIISKEDELYLGTSRGIYILNPKTEKVISRIIPGLNSFVYSMTKDTEDRLWIASRGIYYIENGMIEKSPLPDTEAYSQVYCDNEGYIWATCSGKGAYKFTEESIEMFSKDNCGLETNAVYRVCQLGKDRYLFGTESGISIYDKSINICHNYGSDNGLNLGSMKDGHSIMTCNGIAFIGGTEGLVRISSDVIIDNTCDGSPHIDRVTINGKEYTLSWFDSVKKKLNHTENNISFYLTDDDYTKTSSYYSRYFLEGYSQEWIDAEIGENISFSSLRPGKYRLLLRSSAFKYADEYKESDITFNISPPWYYSATAVIIYILLIVILSILILLIVNRNMLKEERIKAKEKENEDRMKFFHCCPEKFYHKVSCLFESSSGAFTGSSGLL